ncbi:hypothetical protein BLNAU_1611 [Blattamonas nauphoetae]|uniref:Uncharacterized protein n=1 Tax=Blattamonas nauphoetae TaxID=2049346 RepID=A0ABQ9YIJ0_9EUKA|nr:hypothetical protein BLNAU_1611 [Blattamonas nauphoetae]
MYQPFLKFRECSELKFRDQSTLYCSLVALVKDEYPFDEALEDKAVQFLKSLEPNSLEQKLAAKLITDLVSSSTDSPSGFVGSILTLLSSPYSTVVAATLSLLLETTRFLYPADLYRLVKSDLIHNVLAAVQPHSLQILGNEKIIHCLIKIIDCALLLAFPVHLSALALTTPINTWNYHEMIFQKVVLSSSQFLTFLITNRHTLFGLLADSFTYLLGTFIRISPFHRRTLEFVLASPIVMAFSSCLSLVGHYFQNWRILCDLNTSLTEWGYEGPQVVKSGKRMIKALSGWREKLGRALSRFWHYLA